MDGKLVGDIGEAFAEEVLGLDPLPENSKRYDAVDANGTMVQVKTTQGTEVVIGYPYERLVVLKLNVDGSLDIIYDGPGEPLWDDWHGKSRVVSFSRLRQVLESADGP